MDLIDSPIVDRNEYDNYNFKEANWMIYYLYLCGTVPYTFYIKYSVKLEQFDYHNLNEIPNNDLELIKDTIKNSKYNDMELEEVRQEIIKNFNALSDAEKELLRINKGTPYSRVIRKLLPQGILEGLSSEIGRAHV